MGQWVKWVSFLDGSCGPWIDALSLMTHLHIYRRPGGKYWQSTVGFMTHVTCRLTAKNRVQLRNPTLGNRDARMRYLYFFTACILCGRRNRPGCRWLLLGRVSCRTTACGSSVLSRATTASTCVEWRTRSVHTRPRRESPYSVRTAPVSLSLTEYCVPFFSRPRSEGWPHCGRTFSIYP